MRRLVAWGMLAYAAVCAEGVWGAAPYAPTFLLCPLWYGVAWFGATGGVLCGACLGFLAGALHEFGPGWEVVTFTLWAACLGLARNTLLPQSLAGWGLLVACGGAYLPVTTHVGLMLLSRTSLDAVECLRLGACGAAPTAAVAVAWRLVASRWSRDARTTNRERGSWHALRSLE